MIGNSYIACLRSASCGSRCLMACALLIIAPALVRPALASDHRWAREGRAQGALVPLARLIAEVEQTLGARVLDAELDRGREGPYYELEALLPDGRLLELEYDANTGQLRKLKGKRLETIPGLHRIR